MMDAAVLFAMVGAMLAGTALGTFTGLVPGIHVNTMALLMLLGYPSLAKIIEPYCNSMGLDLALVPLLLSCTIVSAAATHSFLDFIPSVFIGVPDEEDCLSLLPGHRLLLAGKGLTAVRLAAEGSLCGAMVALLLSIPLLLLFQSEMAPLERLDGYIPGLLTVLVLLMVLSQRQERGVRATFLVRSYSQGPRTSIIPIRPAPQTESVVHGRARRRWWRYDIETAQGTFPCRFRGRLPSGPLALQGRWVLTRRRWTPAVLALGSVLLSGLLGVAVLWGHTPSPGWSGVDGNMMFPLLTGLFGVPSLLSSPTDRTFPVQRDEPHPPLDMASMLSGSLSGLLAGLVPGVTSTSATVSASMMCPESGRNEEANAGRFIAMSAAVGTAAMVFGVLALASTGQGGTGALLVVKDMLGDSTVSSMGRFTSAHLALLLLSVLLSSLLAYVLTMWIGAILARRSSGRSGGRLSRPVLLLVVALCAVMCGPAGLLVLCTATLVGALPPALGVSRVCLTGCLLLPLILAGFGWRPPLEHWLELMA